MNLKFDYLDNKITLTNDIVNVIEIENKAYLHRIINDIKKYVVDGEIIDSILFYDNDFNEINASNKCKLLIDYFNIDFNVKKNISALYKKINDNINEEERLLLLKEYNKIAKIISKILNKIDISISVNNELNFDDLYKFLKVYINQSDDLLENLFLYIDICKELSSTTLIFLINIKDYLKQDELIELYKYAIYNSINLVLIDSHCYGTTLKYEKKLIIDENLDEIVI